MEMCGQGWQDKYSCVHKYKLTRFGLILIGLKRLIKKNACTIECCFFRLFWKATWDLIETPSHTRVTPRPWTRLTHQPCTYKCLIICMTWAQVYGCMFSSSHTRKHTIHHRKCSSPIILLVSIIPNRRRSPTRSGTWVLFGIPLLWGGNDINIDIKTEV